MIYAINPILQTNKSVPTTRGRAVYAEARAIADEPLAGSLIAACAS